MQKEKQIRRYMRMNKEQLCNLLYQESLQNVFNLEKISNLNLVEKELKDVKELFGEVEHKKSILEYENIELKNKSNNMQIEINDLIKEVEDEKRMKELYKINLKDTTKNFNALKLKHKTQLEMIESLIKSAKENI